MGFGEQHRGYFTAARRSSERCREFCPSLIKHFSRNQRRLGWQSQILQLGIAYKSEFGRRMQRRDASSLHELCISTPRDCTLRQIDSRLDLG